MDPDVALGQTRQVAAAYLRASDADDAETMAVTAGMLADAFVALDGWLSAGGFAPVEWDRPAPSARQPAPLAPELLGGKGISL